MSTSKNVHLDAVIKTHNIELEDSKITAYRTQRDKIKVALEQYYGNRMYNPLNSGSYAKKTAINTKFDLDLAVPFKREQFRTLKEMFEDVENWVRTQKENNQFGITQVLRQRRSINLLFEVGGHQLDMDIVPGRELSDGQYQDDFNLNLFDSKVESSIQTNIKKHTELMVDHNLEREVIKLLKVWKTTHKQDMKSFLVELMILSAFDKDSTLADKKLYERLKGSLEFMADNITTIQLVDPANFNNVVSDTLTTSEKQEFKGRFGRMLEDIERSEDKLIEYFPVNTDHTGQLEPNIQPKYKNQPKYSGGPSFA
jgi:hypothetical protein